MALRDFPKFVRDNYSVHEWRHASAVLRTDFRDDWNDIVAILTEFRIYKSHIALRGGRKRKIGAAIDGAFAARGWKER